MAEDFSESESESGMPNGIMVPAFRRNMNPEDRYGSLDECEIIDKNVEKIVDSTLENIEDKALGATLKKLAEDIFGK